MSSEKQKPKQPTGDAGPPDAREGQELPSPQPLKRHPLFDEDSFDVVTGDNPFNKRS